jgi:hypothetical protein
MDKTDLGSETADVVWEVPAYIKGLVDQAMFGGENEEQARNNGIPTAERGLMNHCEESYGAATTAITYNNVQVDNPDRGLSWENVDRWSYSNIRTINMFLDNRDKFTPKLPEKDKQDYIGQMLTLRAWLYFDMVRVYGGVPLILHVQTLDDELAVPRSKTSECIAQIIADLNEAIAIPDEYFPMKRGANDFGRINKAVAYALKGRVLLYYASPQFSSQTPKGTKSADQRWNEAYAACKEAKEKLDGTYGLFKPTPLNAEEAIQNYFDLFHTEMNEEMVWVRRYEENVFNFGDFDKNFRPATSYGTSYFTTLEFANGFGKADGTPYTGLAIDPSVSSGKALGDVVIPGKSSGDGITNVAFWQNREPRFYAYIAYNGSYWPLVRKEQNKLGNDVVDGKLQHQWTFKQQGTDGENPFDQTEDNTNSRGKGLLIRKFADPTRDYSGTGVQCGTDWPLIRYAEVLLNFAEAAAKTNHASEAYEVLDAIRRRAGIPSDNNYGIGRPTGDALIAAILHERAIELAFESFRFYDVRRWRQFTEDLVPGTTTLYGSKLNGMRRHAIKAGLINTDSEGKIDDKIAAVNAILAHGSKWNDSPEAVAEYFKLFYHYVMVYDGQPFSYSTEKEDFLRIPYSHIKSNPIIKQTAGWTDDRGPGTFDPYE